MAFTIELSGYAPAKTVYAYLYKYTKGVKGDVWNDVTGAWVAGSVPLGSDAERVTLTAGTGVEDSVYSGTTSADLASYTGQVQVNFVDNSLLSPAVITSYITDVVDGKEFYPTHIQNLGAIVEGAEANKAQTVAVYVEIADTGAPATGTVVTTKIATAGAVPVFVNTTNAATYTGSKGLYTVALTAAETNSADPIVIRVTTSDNGTGDRILLWGKRQIETDLEDGGRLDLLVDDILTDTAFIQTTLDTGGVISTAISNIAGDVPTAVWTVDPTLYGPTVMGGYIRGVADHFNGSGAGWGVGDITPARMQALDNLDALVSDRPTTAQVKTQIDTALADIHLDHLLAVDYNPASPPGVATSLLNEITESDGGVTRFTTNALENAPASSGDSAAVVAAAVWDLATSGHVTAGTFGEIITDVNAILADTAALQSEWADGGRLDLLLDACATTSDMTALNDLSTADIDARLAAIGLDHLVSAAVTGPDVANNSIVAKLVSSSATADWDSYVNTTDSLQSLRDQGDTAWVTGAAAGLTAAAIRTEMDTNSTQLAAIVADTNQLQTDWADGGRLDLILDTAAAAPPTAAAIRTEIDTNSTQLAAIVADTNELQTDWANGGRLETRFDTLDTNLATADTNIDDIETSLNPGGTIHTLISNISATPNTLSPETVNAARTWVAPKDLDTARNIIVVAEGDSATYAMDFSGLLNPDAGIALASSVTVVEGDAGDLTIATPTVSQPHTQIHCKITGQLSGKTYKFRLACQTTDGSETISRMGIMQVS